MPLKLPLAMHSALHPLTAEGATIAPEKNTFALQNILAELAGVASTTLPLKRTISMLLPVCKFTSVLAFVSKPLETKAMLPSFGPMTLIATTISFRQLSLSMGSSRDPIAIVHSAVRPPLTASAMWLAILTSLSGVDTTLRHRHILDMSYL
jgi:hypothetical protein